MLVYAAFSHLQRNKKSTTNLHMPIFALQAALPGLGVAPAHLAHLHDSSQGSEAQLSSAQP